METIVFLGTNKSGTSRDVIKEAVKMGFYAVVFTDRSKFLSQRKEFEEVHELILLDLSSEIEIRQKLDELMSQGKDLKGIMSVIDPFVFLAAKLGKEYCHSPLSLECIKQLEDKAVARSLLKGHHSVPFFDIVEIDQDVNQYLYGMKNFPLIVKSPVSNGSKDVFLAENKLELERSLLILKKKFPKSPILIEEYLEGPQYLVEVLAYRGKYEIVAVVKQEVTKYERFIVTGYHFPSKLSSEAFLELQETISSVLYKLNMQNGSCHFEMRLVDSKWKIIEINPRMSGGAMNRIIETGCGVNLAKETIKLVLGEKPEITWQYEKYIFAYFMTIQSAGTLLKVTGKNRASSFPGVEEVYIKPRKGMLLTPPTSMGHRYAYVLASGTSSEEAKQRAQEAAKQIKFYLEPL
ncbi:ATP-grasp domain-containing protein [Bacillus timonensis]|nr:ATP-grasp domain-containing protein [Bacillus timonensis]